MSAVVGTELDGGARLQALVTGPSTRVVAYDHGRPVTREAFESHVRAVAGTLPPAAYAVNLCEDRYRFIVALAAAALRGQVTLLPSSRAPAVVDAVRADHPDSICIGDGVLDPAPPGYHRLPDTLPALDGAPLEIDADAALVIGFTSGSTGQPKPNLKTLASFVASTAQNLAALDDLLAPGITTPLVATVPPQHMYGMEMSVLLPLLGDLAVHGVARIAALAVAPTLDADAILRALRTQMDPVFLPRRLRCVASLPRNETGKLPRATVIELLQG